MWGRRSITLATIALVVLCSVMVTSLAVPDARAQADNDFSLMLNGGAPVDGSTDISVTLDPGTSDVAAIEGAVVYDIDRVRPTTCVALSELGACTTSTPGLITLATVESDGWQGPTELFRISFESTNPVYPQDVSVSVADALTVSGDQVSGTVVQLLPLLGDVSCTRTVDILDAVLIAQHVVGIRGDGASCPLTDGETELNLAVADVNGSGTVSIADAVLIAQCVDGRANVLCPA